MSLPERTCVSLGCNRVVLRSPTGTGWVYAFCESHLRALQTGAFGPDPNERPGAEPTGVAPIRIADDPGATVADVDAVSAAASRVDQPDGDLAGSRRAISSGTPGRSTTAPTSRAVPLPSPAAAQPEVPDRVLPRDGPRPGLVPELDVSAHRGRPDRIPVPSGA